MDKLKTEFQLKVNMHRNRRLLNTQAHKHCFECELACKHSLRFKAEKRYKSKQRVSWYYYSNNTKARSDKMCDIFMVLIMI